MLWLTSCGVIGLLLGSYNYNYNAGSPCDVMANKLWCYRGVIGELQLQL